VSRVSLEGREALICGEWERGVQKWAVLLMVQGHRYRPQNRRKDVDHLEEQLPSWGGSGALYAGRPITPSSLEKMFVCAQFPPRNLILIRATKTRKRKETKNGSFTLSVQKDHPGKGGVSERMPSWRFYTERWGKRTPLPYSFAFPELIEFKGSLELSRHGTKGPE